MPPKKNDATKPDVTVEGVPVRLDRYENVNHHDDGVPVLVPQTPEQTGDESEGKGATSSSS